MSDYFLQIEDAIDDQDNSAFVTKKKPSPQGKICVSDSFPLRGNRQALQSSYLALPPTNSLIIPWNQSLVLFLCMHPFLP